MNTGAFFFVSQVGPVAEVRLFGKRLIGLHNICVNRALWDMLASEDEDDIVSSDEKHVFVRRHVLSSRLSAPSLRVTSPCGALIGPPTAFRRNGPCVPCVSLQGPTGVMTYPG